MNFVTRSAMPLMDLLNEEMFHSDNVEIAHKVEYPITHGLINNFQEFDYSKSPLPPYKSLPVRNQPASNKITRITSVSAVDTEESESHHMSSSNTHKTLVPLTPLSNRSAQKYDRFGLEEEYSEEEAAEEEEEEEEDHHIDDYLKGFTDRLGLQYKFVFVRGKKESGASGKIQKAYCRTVTSEGTFLTGERAECMSSRALSGSKLKTKIKQFTKQEGKRAAPNNRNATRSKRQIFGGSGALIPVAIKRMTWKELSEDPEDFYTLLNREKFALNELCTDQIQPVKRFGKNRQAVRRCSPFLTKFYGSFYKASIDEHWLVFEFCDGGTISCMAKQAVNFKQLAAITVGILKGLEAIHNLGFIHADIKPDNILLRYPGFVKICDYGLASKVKDIDEPEYHALGTVRYMSPELMLKNVLLDKFDPKADECKYDYKTDIWSVGIVLLELILGQAPLRGLRLAEEEIFCRYILRMCDTSKPENCGSGLFKLFYPDKRYQRVINHVIKQEEEAGIPADNLNEKSLLLKRIPSLQPYEKYLGQLLLRKYMLNQRPNPANPVPRLRTHGLFAVNKCLDFIAQCLFNNYHLRPTATQLLEHDFLKLATKEMNALVPRFDAIQEQYKTYRGRKTLWRDYRCSLTVRQVYDVIETSQARIRRKMEEKTRRKIENKKSGVSDLSQPNMLIQ